MSVLSSCKNGGAFNKINIVTLVDPDKVAPTISINSSVTTLNGDQDYTLQYDADDNIGGSGIRKLEIYYSPDGTENNFKLLGPGPIGKNVSVPFCVPNKNHSEPTFKVVAYDKSGNKSTKTIGNVAGAQFSIATTTPTVPTLTSSKGLLTNNINTALALSFCPQTQCSAQALRYENYPVEKYVLFNDAAQPLSGDASWLSCSTVLSNKYTTPDFTVDGDYNFKVWTKTSDKESDGTTPLHLISSTSNQITVTYDHTPPTISITDLTYVPGGKSINVTFTESDLHNIGSNKLQYAVDGTNFVDVASNIASPYSWSAPLDNSLLAKLKFISTDTLGNSTSVTTSAFTIDSTAPSAPVPTLTSPYISSSSNMTLTVPSCLDTDKILVGESPIAPGLSDSGWTNCAVAPTNISYTLTGPILQGLHTLYIWGKDLSGNISASGSVDVIYDTVAPTINLNAFNALYKGGDSITLDFSTTDDNGVSSFKLEYSPDGVTYSLLSTLATNATSYTWTIPVSNTSLARFRFTSVDNATTANTHVLVSPNFTIDTTPPNTAPLFIEGTTLTGKSLGRYRLNDCSDVAKVMVIRGGSTTPLETDPGWQTCSSSVFTLTTNDLVAGNNALKFWVKDGAGNVAPAYLSFSTTYNPPWFHVENGPTISTTVADISIQFCDEATISSVLFNETGTQPIAADISWQSCSTVVGALKSMSLSPGAHTLKAFFKYADGVISKNPIDIYVDYTSTLAWAEPPSVNRPQTKFTLASCAGIDQVFLNKGAAPLATDPGWQPCSSAIGGMNFDGLAQGVNTINAWFKDASGNLYSNHASTTATYVPPQAVLNNGTTIQDPTAKLSITDCNNISEVYVVVDSASAPNGNEGGWTACSTANNAISSPVLTVPGAHTLYTWFKYTDNYILPDPDMDGIVFDPYDVTPPDINGTKPGNTAVNLTLNNGYDDDANGTTPPLLVKDNMVYLGPQDNTSRALFTINTCSPTGSADPKEDITSVLISTQSDIALIYANDPYWNACTTAINGVQSASLNDGADIPLYFYFKDASGNIAGYNATNTNQTVHVKVNTAIDITPPPRPYVEITTPPTLTSSPAQLWINDTNGCSDIDQVYINIYSRKYNGLDTETLDEAQPAKTAAGWQSCIAKPGVVPNPVPLASTFNFPIILAGSYTLNVWFKDAAGNINSDPRRVSFIFDPVPSSLPEAIAHWSFDQNHFYKNRMINIKGNDHLSVYPYSAASVSTVNGKIKEGYNFSGNKYALTKNSSVLQPTISVSMSAWVSLTQNDLSNKFIAGNMVGIKGYGLTLEAGLLRFYVSGRKAEVATNTYSSGIHNVVGTSDGRYIYLYIDGSLVASDDSGAPSNIEEGSSVVFAVGAKPNATTNFDVGDPRFFNASIDELVVWDKYLTSTQVFRHYVDGMNILKVNEQHTVPSPTLASSVFYGEFMQNALVTVPTCNGISFIYVNETTHPPGANSSWQPCTTLPGAIVYPNLSQGYHQLKVWTKDSYDNISSSYALIDTTITGIIYQAPPEIYFTLDNNQYLNSIVRDLFSGLFADNLGATSNQTGVGFKNEGFYFTATSQNYVEALYATPSQLTDKVTLSSWTKLTANDNRTRTISGNTGYSISIDQASNELAFSVITNAGARKASVLTSYYATGYHNIIGSYDGRYVKLYIDGNLADSQDYTTTESIVYSCMSSFTIGAGASCNSGPVANTYFDGGIDEVIVWNDSLSSSTVHDFFNGQDNVPPEAVPVEPKGNSYHINIPVASFKVTNCSDVSSVYVTLGSSKPTSAAPNWQACTQTAYSIKSPLLDNSNNPGETANLLHFWFKDAAGNVSDTSTDVTIFYLYDFTVPNPLAYWPFDIANSHDQIATDVIGGHDATKTDTAFITGAGDEAIIFNGATSFAEVAHTTSDFDLTNKVSLTGWFKIGSYPAGLTSIAGNFKNGGYGLMLNNSQLVWRVKVNNANAFDEISYSLPSTVPSFDFAKWHHVVGIYDQGYMRLFFDGSEVTNSTIPDVGPGVKPSITYAQSNSFLIGALPTTTIGTGGGHFDGAIDEVAIFNDAITDTVVTEIYNRGSNNDKVAYLTVPPTIPTNLNIIYYNSLVSRANLTVTDCTGLTYIIVTNSKFPPDKNDEDWQLCNTMIGGLLTKELSSSDAYGKLWTKDAFGNISRSFEYVPINTKYDKPIQRPAAHWTFDSDHYNSSNYRYIDRLGKIEMQSVQLYDDVAQCDAFHGPATAHPYGHHCFYINSSQGVPPTTGGVLNQKVLLGDNQFLRVDNTSTVKPTDKLSVGSWVYIPQNYDPGVSIAETHVVSTWDGGKGYAIRAVYDPVNPRIEFTVKPAGQAALAPYLETKNFISGWHLVLGTYEASTGTAKLYVDGIFIKQFTAATPANIEYSAGVKFMVGSNPNTTQYPDGFTFHADVPFSGIYYAGYVGYKYPYNIDEVLVWNKVVTGLEASSLYHNGADVLYPGDTTAPVKPSLALENSRPSIDTNKAYFSLSSCTDISGVLVNEGTRPDKQDDRWQVCRTRLGSFGITNLTPGGHTITFWFKDLAGNVTASSQDYVVNYLNNPTPRANSYWPLDSNQLIGNYTRDVISTTKEHELVVTGLNRDNSSGGNIAAKANEGFNLAGNGYISLYDGLSVANSSRLIRPVNYMTVGGWYYLTSADAGTKTLVDNLYNEGGIAGGYKLYLSASKINFTVGLDLNVSGSNKVTVSVATNTYATGWHHVLGVWTGTEVKLYLDNVRVATSGTLPEVNYIRYIDNSSNPLLTYFRIGADSEGNTNLPGNFFNEKVDEQAVWGFDLTAAQVQQVYNAGTAGQNMENSATSPANVDNAYVYFNDSFGSRVRLTMLDCTNTPYIYVGDYNAIAVRPVSNDPDWVDCRTENGAILSSKIGLGTTPQYVHVWSKNIFGVVSTIPATLEIPVNKEPDTLVLPRTYYSFNANQISAAQAIDFLGRRQGTITGAATNANGINQEGLLLSNTKYFTTEYNFNLHFQRGFTAGFWAYLSIGDATSQILLSPPADQQALKIYLSGGYLNFNIKRGLDTAYGYKNTYTDGSFATIDDNFTIGYPTSGLSYTGWYFITATYDQQNMNLYLNGDLVASDNAPRMKWQGLTNRAITITSTPYYRLGDATTPFNNKVDELMMWDIPLTQKEIIAHYIRVAHQAAADTVPPVTAGRTIAVNESTFGGGKWSSEDSRPYITINDCSDVTGIYIKINDNGVPRYDDVGWQICSTKNGAIQLPALSNINGDNDVYIWIKDAAGNVNSVPLSTVITYNQVPYPTPVGYWSFDNVSLNEKFVFDYGPNHLRTELFGASSVNHTSSTDNALSFDANRGYVRVEGSTVYKPTNRLGISYWINPSNLNCNFDEHILGTNNSINGYSVRLDGNTPGACTATNASLTFEVTVNGSRKSVRIPASQLPAGWIHVVHTFDGRKLFTYVNGGLANGGKEYYLDLGSSQPITYDADQDPLIIGAAPNKLGRPTDLDEYFSGSIDEVAIFNHALFPHQVTDLYNKGLAGTKVYNPARALENNAVTLSSRFAVYQPGSTFTFGSRIKATVSDCTGMDLVLVNNSSTQPNANDPDWQKCNTADGGILSAPVGTNLGSDTAITPKIWVRTFDGTISTNYGTANNAPVTIPAHMQDIPRPTAYWTFDSVSRKHQDGTHVFDFLGSTTTIKPVGFTPSTASAITEDGFNFDGISTYLQASNSPNTNPMINMSITAWAYLTKGETTIRTIASNSFGSEGAGLRTNAGKLEFFLNALENSTSTATINSTKYYMSVGIDTNTYETGWHHVAGTYDGKYLKIYLDGVYTNSYQIQFYNPAQRHVIYHDDVTPWMIGASPGATTLTGGINTTIVVANTYFNNGIDELGIFDSALSETEVYYVYLYGSQFKPGTIHDTNAPTDPGIALDPNASSTSSPFAYLTMPTCLGANGKEINSVYVTVNGAAVPEVYTSGWQHCNLDPRGIMSPLLGVGTNTITIYYKDNDNNISTPVTFTITYTPPLMPNPMAYWTLNSADVSGSYYNDRIGSKNLRSVGDGKGYQLSSAKEAQGYQTIMYNGSTVIPSYQSIFYNWSIGLSPDKDFATSFWYYTSPYFKNGTLISKGGTFSISRNTSDYLSATIVTTTGTYSLTSTTKMAPNSWNHITLTRTGASAKLFLNGKPILNFVMTNANLVPSPNQLVLLDTEGIIDDVSLYNVGLNDDQVYYNYYLGAKSTPSILDYAYRPNPQPAPIPSSYWTFDDAQIDMMLSPTRQLLDKTGSNFLTIKEDISNAPISYLGSSQTGAFKKANQAFFFKRYETTINNPNAGGGDYLESENTVGVPQYLEASGPINLYDNFSLAGWVNFTKTSYHTFNSLEFYTVLDQWGSTADNQSFRLYQTMPASGNKLINFDFRTLTKGPFTLTATLHKDLSFNSWHHIAVVRKGRIVSIFVDKIESASIDINTLEPVLVPVTSKLRFAETNMSTDEGRFEGYLDEWAIWNNKTLTVEQLEEVYNKGVNGNSLSIDPMAVLANAAGSTTSELSASLTLNDCGPYTDVFVGFVGDTPPLATDPGWQTCSTVNGAIKTASLTPDSSNNVRIWFKNGSGVAGYTYDVTINHVTTDNVAPVPPVISMVTPSPTDSAFASFTLSTCADGAGTIFGVYVGTTGNPPTASQDGWGQCSTVPGALTSFPLEEGTNNISVWFKDAAGNISKGAQDFSLIYSPPLLPDPNIYLGFTFNNGVQPEFSQVGPYIRDAAQSAPFSIANIANTVFKFAAVVDDGAEFQGTSYLESQTYTPVPGAALSVSAWINIPAPGIQASIINQWDGTAANNSFAVTIDSNGRVCLDFQTTFSLGSASWSTNSYRHSCSLGKISFGLWSHISVVRNTTSVNYYIDGFHAGSDTIDGSSLKASTLPLRVAGQQRNGGYTISGQIDEVLLYTTNLTQKQIEKIYARGYNNISVYDDIQPQEAAVPLAYFDMDSANYNVPAANMLQTNWPENNNLYFTDLNAGAPTNYTTAVAGMISDARTFYGKNILESNTNNIPVTNDFSMGLWVKPAIGGNNHVLVSKWEASVAAPVSQAIDQFQLVLDESFGTITTKFYYHTTDSTTWGNIAFSALNSGTKTFNQGDGLWHYLAVTRKGAYLSLYVDGQLASVANIGSAPFVNSTQKLRLGGMNSTATNTFVGSIDEFTLIDKALSERQIMNNFMIGRNNIATTKTVKLSAAHHTNTIKATLPVTKAKLTVNDCLSFTDVLIQPTGGPAPASGDANWVSCTTAIGAIESPALNNGSNDLEMWMKTGGTVEAAPTTTVTIIVNP